MLRLSLITALMSIFLTCQSHADLGYAEGVNSPLTLSSNCWLSWCDFSFLLNHTTPTTFRNKFQTMIGRAKDIELSESSKLYKAHFGDSLTGLSLLQWISYRISEIGYNADENPKAYGQVDRMWLPPDYMVFTSMAEKISKTMMFAVLLHEARHGGVNESGFSHNYCKKNEESGEYEVSKASDTGSILACDISYDGAFGVTYTAMCNIANFCLNCATDETEDAIEAARKSMILITSGSTRAMLRRDCNLPIR